MVKPFLNIEKKKKSGSKYSKYAYYRNYFTAKLKTANLKWELYVQHGTYAVSQKRIHVLLRSL